MKRLFLASFAAYTLDKLIDNFNLTPKNLHLAFIPTAADPYPPEKKGFVKEERDALVQKGFKVRDVDINRKTKDKLEKELKDIDVVFVGGGNTFYLLEKTRESGFDEIVTRLVDKGVVYIGSSAGSVLAGPDIEPVSSLDDPEKAPNLASTKGLGLVDFVVVPHLENEKFDAEAKEILSKYKDYKHKLIPISDQQSVVVEGNKYDIV